MWRSGLRSGVIFIILYLRWIQQLWVRSKPQRFEINEIRVLETHYPAARILMCHFHVIKYLKEMRSKADFGKISGEDASQVDAIAHKMVYAQSEARIMLF